MVLVGLLVGHVVDLLVVLKVGQERHRVVEVSQERHRVVEVGQERHQVVEVDQVGDDQTL